MKKEIKTFGIFAAGITAISFVVGLTPSNIGKDVSKKLTPLELHELTYDTDRYSVNDLVKEPLAENYYKYNYAAINVGGNSVASSTVWNNYRGETKDNKKIKVCVIDSGVDLFHEDFLLPSAKGKNLNLDNIAQYSIVSPQSFFCHVNAEQTGYVMEDGLLKAYDTVSRGSSHGTSCASLIASAVNGVGAFGVSPNVELIIGRTDKTVGALTQSLYKAADLGADVISISAGLFEQSFTSDSGEQVNGVPGIGQRMSGPVEYAINKGCVVVASAGNYNANYPHYPSACKGVIAVGALGELSSTEKAWFSNTNGDGTTAYTDNNVDVMAPGFTQAANIGSYTPIGPGQNTAPHKVHEKVLGTSFSTPIVTGAVALYLSKYPHATPAEVKEQICASAADIGTTGWDKQFGFGRLDVLNLLQDNDELTEVKLNNNEVVLSMTMDNDRPTKSVGVTYIPSSAKESSKPGKWSIKDPSIATVDANTGVITAVKPGTTKVTFTTNLNGISATATVKVVDTNIEDCVLKTTYIKRSNVIESSLGTNDLSNGRWSSGVLSGPVGKVLKSNKEYIRLAESGNEKMIASDTYSGGHITTVGIQGFGAFDVYASKTPFTTLDDTKIEGLGAVWMGYVESHYDYYTDVNFTGKYPYFAIVSRTTLGVPAISDIKITHYAEKPTINMTTKDVTIEIDEEQQIICDANGPITWTVKDSSVASVSNTGKVKGLSIGQTIVTATNETVSAQCTITVKTNVHLDYLTISEDSPKTMPYCGEYPADKVKVVAHYTNGGQTKVVPAFQINTVDSSILGPQKVRYQYMEDGVGRYVEHEIFVSTVGVTPTYVDVPGPEATLKMGPDNFFKLEGGSLTDDKGNVWQMVAGQGRAGTFKYDDTRGELIERIFKQKQISLFCDYYSEVEADNVSIQVQGDFCEFDVSMIMDGMEVPTIAEPNNIYRAQINGCGSIEIKINIQRADPRDSWVAFDNIKIQEPSSVKANFDETKQAQAFNKFIRQDDFRTCPQDHTSRDEIVMAVNEFNGLLQGAKDSQLLREVYDDHGYNTTVIDKLKMMVDTYNRTLQDNETQITLKLSPTEEFTSFSSSQITIINDDFTFTIIFLSLVILSLAISFGLIMKHRHKFKNNRN